MKKLTRKGQVLIFVCILIFMLSLGFVLVHFNNDQSNVEENQYEIQIVSEDQDIISTYVDSISSDKSSDDYQLCTINLDKDMQIGKYKLTQQQSFSKYLKLQGPKNQEILSSKIKQNVTHYAYSLLLTGDLQEKTNLKTKEKIYEVVNARITYDIVPIVLLSNENSVHIASQDKKKDKVMNLQDFINALKNIEQRKKLLTW